LDQKQETLEHPHLFWFEAWFLLFHTVFFKSKWLYLNASKNWIFYYKIWIGYFWYLPNQPYLKPLNVGFPKMILKYWVTIQFIQSCQFYYQRGIKILKQDLSLSSG
jgi:hypothetical protein